MSDSEHLSAADYSRRAESTVLAAAQRHLELVALSKDFGALEHSWRTMAASQVEVQTQLAQAEFDQAARAIRERAGETEAALLRTLQFTARQLAPGPMSRDWSADDWADEATSVQPQSGWIRVGSISPSQDPHAKPAPALVPLLNSAGWSVGASAADFAALVQGTLLRIFAAIPLHRLEVMVYDPDLELQLGLFAPIRDASPHTVAPTITRVDHLQSALEDAVQAMVRVTDELSSQGVSTVEEHWRATGSLDLTYRVLILNGYPRGITRQVHELLLQIARTTGTRGVSMIVRRESNAGVETSVDWRALTGLLSAMEVTPGVISAAALPNTVVSNDGPPGRGLVESLVIRLAGVGSRASMPSIPLSDVLDGIPDPWAEAEFDGLRCAFGRVGRKPLELRLLSADPPLPNALIGGATGQGKSNLLLAIIHSLAVRYRPDQLRMYLLDFRQGVELSSLGPSDARPYWLPHAEVLGLESDREFGLSVLQYLVDEFTRRSELLTRAGAKSIVDYRRDGHGDMPRLVLVIDEFQMLIDGDDDISRRSVELLEQIARQGRGYGVHLILASQTTSGIRGLATKGEAIFGQFPNRLSLKNTTAESQAILGQGNTAAAALAHRGEIVVNENFGDPESNKRGTVALADESSLRQLRRILWERSHTDPPLVFFGARPAQWDTGTCKALREGSDMVAANGRYQLWAARPVSVVPTPIRISIQRESDQAILLVGSDEGQAAGVLSATMVSLALQAQPATRWIVLDGLSADPASDAASAPEWLSAAMQLAAANGHTVEYRSRPAVREWLIGPGRQLLMGRQETDPDTFVFVVAPQRIPDLETAETAPSQEVGGLADYVIPREVLATLVKDGGPRGVFVIGWWLNMRTAVAHLGYQTPGVGAHVLFGLSREELQGLLDPRQPLPQGNPRVIVKDPRVVPEVRIGIPFEPVTHSTLRRIMES